MTVYDEDLAFQIEQGLKEHYPVKHKAKCGMCFILNGHLLCTVMGKSVVIRIDPGKRDEYLHSDKAVEFDFRGKKYNNWIKIIPENGQYSEEVGRWLKVAVDTVRSLPGVSLSKSFICHGPLEIE